MKKITLTLSLLLASVLLMQCGPSTGSDGAKSPEALFNALKSIDRSGMSSLLPYVAPDDRCLLSFASDFGASFMTAFSKDKSLKDQYADIRTKYRLPDNTKSPAKLNDQAAMLEYARANYKDVDHAAFIKEVQGIMARIPNMTMKKKSRFKSMQDLKVEGNTASATAVTEDGKTEKLDFVQVDGIWYLSIQTSFMK
jgi:hypothetical protein